MLRTVHTAIPARVLAALVALGLSGVSALTVEPTGEGHGASHRCHCPAGRHDCRCPVCRSAGHGAHDARRAAIAELPECHRAKALEALAQEEAVERRGTRSAAPCVRSGCDAPEDRLPTSASQDSFVIPGRAVLCARGWMTPVPAPAETVRTQPRVPELPPPRRA